MTSEVKQFIVRVGGAEVDLTDLPPMTLGDKKALRKLGVDFTKLVRENLVEPDDEAIMALYMLQKRRAETTMAEVDALSVLTAARVRDHIMTRTIQPDENFSTRSTSLATPTDGASANLNNSLAQNSPA